MELVTDKSLIDDLNRSMHIQNNILPQIHKIDDPGALSTFFRSAKNAVPGAIGNVMLKLGLTTPEIMQEALYGKGKRGQKIRESYEQGQMAHPIADIGGGMVGFGPVGFGTSAALRSIPLVGRAVRAAAPSLLKRTGVHALEGGAINSIYSPPGEEGEAMGTGALIGGILGGPGVSAYRAFPNLNKSARNVTNIEELKSNRNQSHKSNVEQEELINALKKQYAEQAAGLSKPESITRKINERMSDINEMEPDTQIPFRQTENLLQSPEQFNTREAAQQTTREAQERLRDVHHMMEPGATHDVEFANRFQENVRHIKRQIQRTTYDPAYSYAENQHVAIPRVGAIEDIDTQLREATGNLFERNPHQFEELRNSLISQRGGTHDLVPMTDYLGQWKATRHAANRAQSLSRKEGEPDQAFWEREGRNLQNLADRQLELLRNHMPENLFNGLLRGNQLWRENVTPLYGNKIYEQSKNARGSKGRGRIDVSNIMHELRGNEAGQRLARQITLSDPELNRLAISHTYSAHPERLLNLNQNESQFLNAHPGLGPAVEHLRQARFNENIANRLHENRQTISQESHARFIKEETPRQKQRQKAIEESNKLKKEIEDLQSKREKLSTELEKGRITKAQFEKLDSELSAALKYKQSFLKTIAKIAGYGVATYGINEVIKKILKK